MSGVKKIAIITHYYNSLNYGGLLQAYALSKVIEELGYDCDVLKTKLSSESIVNQAKGNFFSREFDNYRYDIKSKGFFRASVKLFIKLNKNFAEKVFLKIRKKQILSIKNNVKSRSDALAHFRECKIKHNAQLFSEDNIVEGTANYNIFICGSDQVWNPNYTGMFSDIYWLKFVSNEKIKIAYAASAGQEGFLKEHKEELQKTLSGYSGVSVREKSLKMSLVRLLPDEQKVEWVLDPTLLMEQDNWRSFCSPRLIDEEYVFVYFLGDNLQHRKLVKEFAEKQCLKIVALPFVRYCDVNFTDIDLHDISPERWVSLIKYSKYVFTDSFHGCAFSGIFHTEFYVLKRHKDTSELNMNSRIYSLMEIFEASHRVIDDDTPISEIEKIQPINFNILDKKVELMRKKSISFLKNALV